jgi:predicted PurR-regulated permease PerM
MLAPSTRTIVRVFLTVAACAAALYFCYLIRHVLGLVFIAGFLAVALGPPVGFFRQRLGLPPVLAILLVYVLIVGAIFGVGLLVVPPMVSQVQGLANDIPGYLQDLRKNDQFRKYDEKYDITTKLSEQARKLPSKLGTAVGTLRSITVGVFSALVELVTVLTMTFFLLRDGGRIVGFLFGLARPERERRLRAIAGDVYRSVSGYVAGNLLISLIAGTTTYVALEILGVPFAVPLAVLMAFLDLIPLIGATIGGVVVGIVTAFTDFPTATIVWAIVFVVYQQVENNLLQPVVYRRTVDVHPLLVIVAILIGAGLLGVLGALIAIPIAATVQIIARDEWAHRRGAGAVPPPGAESPPTPPDAPARPAAEPA